MKKAIKIRVTQWYFSSFLWCLRTLQIYLSTLWLLPTLSWLWHRWFLYFILWWWHSVATVFSMLIYWKKEIMFSLFSQQMLPSLTSKNKGKKHILAHTQVYLGFYTSNAKTECLIIRVIFVVSPQLLWEYWWACNYSSCPIVQVLHVSAFNFHLQSVAVIVWISSRLSKPTEIGC